MKKVFYTELAYVLGLITLAFGIALLEAVNFGISMEVAPPYLIYLKVSSLYANFTFGMSEFIWQMFLMLLMIGLLRKFKFSYLFSFVTAGFYALVLDGSMRVIAHFPMKALGIRVACFVIAMLLCEIGISLLFHTYIPQLVYELFVQEISSGFGVNLYTFKTGFDCMSCFIGIALSFLFFGMFRFEGVKLGTIIGALINGWMINQFSHFLEKHWKFEDKFRRCTF